MNKFFIVGIIAVFLSFSAVGESDTSVSSAELGIADTEQCIQHSSDNDLGTAGLGATGYCCKTCNKGKACGDSCISRDKTCRKGPGCACDG